MKTIGLIGGMSWESSLEYYRIINAEVKRRLGGFHSAKSVMVSVDFAEIEAMQMQGRWDDAAQLLCHTARQVERGGADCVVLCTNTMHKVAEALVAAVDIPLLHIADASAAAVHAQGLKRVGLLGTRFTMEQDFYRTRLEQHGLNVLIPDTDGRDTVHRIIYDELVLGIINPTSREQYQAIIQAMNVEGIVLGCTEIGLLIKAEDSPVPIFDTTLIHAKAAVDWALGDL